MKVLLSLFGACINVWCKYITILRLYLPLIFSGNVILLPIRPVEPIFFSDNVDSNQENKPELGMYLAVTAAFGVPIYICSISISCQFHTLQVG